MTRTEKTLLRQALAIIEEDRQIIFESGSLADGTLPHRDDRAEIRKLDRWIEKAKAVLA